MARLLATAQPRVYLPAALEILSRGGVVALPTETVYGLAASLLDPRGVERIFALKGRPEGSPLPLQFGSFRAAESYGFRFSKGARKAGEIFWPGPLTLVLERPAVLPEWCAPGSQSIAIRVPDHPVALALLLEFAHPLAVTSANRSGEPPAMDAAEVLAAFPEAGDLLVLDGGRSPGGLASTVVDGRTAEPALLRAGPIPWGELEEAWRS